MKTFLDELAVKCGFEDANEMLKLVASIDLSTPEKRQAFNKWKVDDGTKEGLLKLKESA